MRSMLGRKLMVGMVAMAAALGASTAPAVAATSTVYNVTTTQDASLANPSSTTCTTSSDSPAQGKCSLRAALEAAGNVLTGDVTINVPKGTYTLTQSQLKDSPCQGCGIAPVGDTALLVAGDSDNPTETISILGAGAPSTIVDANFTDRAFDVQAGTTASISGMTIENGRSGGQDNVNGCPSSQTSEADGGGIADDGTKLTLTDDLVEHNIAAGGGGGIDAAGGQSSLLFVKGTTVKQNDACQSSGEFRDGGGIDVTDGGTVDVYASTVEGNAADPDGDGGGIEEESAPATFHIVNSTIAGNSAFSGGGIGAEAGGSWNFSGDTLSKNSASNNGGGFMNDGGDSATFVNTTVSGNDAGSDGGGMWSICFTGGQVISFSTIVDNSAGFTGNLSFECDGAPPPHSASKHASVKNAPVSLGGAYQLDDSIVAEGHGSDPNCDNFGFGFIDDGHNLFDDTSDNGAECGSGPTDDDQVVANPELGTLTNNGGPTKTVALLPVSKAIDNASLTACKSETKGADGKLYDQRHFTRPEAPNCDIGAFESNPDLSIGGSVQKSPILVGQQDTVTQTIQDGAFYQADNTVFSDPGAGYKIDSVSSTQGTCTHTSTSVTCHLNTVALHGKNPPKVKIVLTGLTPGTITLHGKVTTPGDDPTPGNNKDTVKIKVKALPKPPAPTVVLAPLGAACYRDGSTVAIHVKASAPAGIRTLTIKVGGRTIKTYKFTSSSTKHKNVTLHIRASKLMPGHTYTASAKVTDTLGRSASSSRTFTVCKHHRHHHGFTG